MHFYFYFSSFFFFLARALAAAHRHSCSLLPSTTVELIIQNFDKLLGSKTGLDEAAEEEVFDEADPVDEAADTGDGGKTLERGSRLARKSVKRSAPQRPAPPPPAALSKAVSPLARRRAASDVRRQQESDSAAFDCVFAFCILW